jgi:hypothetical protein
MHLAEHSRRAGCRSIRLMSVSQGGERALRSCSRLGEKTSPRQYDIFRFKIC